MHTTDDTQLELQEPFTVQVQSPVSTKKITICMRFRRFFTLDVLPNEKHYYPIFIIILSIIHISIHLTTYINIEWKDERFIYSLHDLWMYYIPCMRPTPYDIRMLVVNCTSSIQNVTCYYGDELQHKCFSFLYPYQLWRMFTVILIHADWFHLLLNLLRQLLFGILLERKYGSFRIVIVYWLSNVGAILCAMLEDSRKSGIGASGAIYGLSLFFIIERLNAMKTNINHRFFILMQLILFVVFPMTIIISSAAILGITVGHAAHFGGGLVGFLFGIALSFNQLDFSSTPIWDSNGITFADRSIVGKDPRAIFVNTNNTIYVANKENNTIIMWDESVNPIKIIRGNFTEPWSLFVTSNGDIYIDDGEKNGRVQKWVAERNVFVTVMNVNSSCWGLFVDVNGTLYCSMPFHHQVVKRSLNDAVMTSNHVAVGTGIEGSASNQLSGPSGIFVDVNLDLYVADCWNDRVQLFRSGESNGIIVAGSTSLNPTIKLDYPSGIILDADKYLFIVDAGNHRIVSSGLNGFRCLVGCDGVGSQSNQLNDPFSFCFDGSGNMFVADSNNDRIQKIFMMKDSFALSFNQPNFSSSPVWDSNGITIANRSIVGQWPRAIFVNRNNTIYVANLENNTIIMWDDESVNPTKIISGNFTLPVSLFVTSNGDIYIDDGGKNGRVQKWIAERNVFVTVMNVNSSCWGLFVDVNGTLYCSMPLRHQVVKRSLKDSVMASDHVAAGTGIWGSPWKQFNNPLGIFVDVNLDLYVADCNNDRVQLFRSGESNGITVAGSTSLNPTITLSCPSGIILDVEKYLFIVDGGNNRIVSSDLNGFRCLVGCDGVGSQSNQLHNPFSFSFDHSGNIFVTDYRNSRIQKFLLMKDSF
ncbi:unnamed protein product, partial [Adineta steineri]